MSSWATGIDVYNVNAQHATQVESYDKFDLGDEYSSLMTLMYAAWLGRKTSQTEIRPVYKAITDIPTRLRTSLRDSMDGHGSHWSDCFVVVSMAELRKFNKLDKAFVRTMEEPPFPEDDSVDILTPGFETLEDYAGGSKIYEIIDRIKQMNATHVVFWFSP